MPILTKDAILKGKNNIEAYNIESLGGEIYLRPLTQGEWTEIEKIEAKALGSFKTSEKARKKGRRQLPSSLESSGEINAERQTAAAAQARIETIRLSINNEKNADEWTTEEINSLTKKQVTELFEKVREISDVDNEELEEDIEDFPE